MAEAFIYDHVRTPRGRGKKDGSLHEVPAVRLSAKTLEAVRDRNELDTSYLDDVVMGCVSPVGEQGANVARVGALYAEFAENVPGKQLNRFCASGLEAVNTIASQIMAGQSDLGIVLKILTSGTLMLFVTAGIKCGGISPGTMLLGLFILVIRSITISVVRGFIGLLYVSIKSASSRPLNSAEILLK